MSEFPEVLYSAILLLHVPLSHSPGARAAQAGGQGAPLEHVFSSFLWICCAFWLMVNIGVPVCWPVGMFTCFKPIVIQVQAHSKRYAFVHPLLCLLWFCCPIVHFILIRSLLIVVINPFVSFLIIIFNPCTGLFKWPLILLHVSFPFVISPFLQILLFC